MKGGRKRSSPIITRILVMHHMVTLSKVLLKNEIANSREANMVYSFHLIIFLFDLNFPEYMPCHDCFFPAF
jgi:hypothetical protein